MTYLLWSYFDSSSVFYLIKKEMVMALSCLLVYQKDRRREQWKESRRKEIHDERERNEGGSKGE
jgi:hypothetical protein